MKHLWHFKSISADFIFCNTLRELSDEELKHWEALSEGKTPPERKKVETQTEGSMSQSLAQQEFKNQIGGSCLNEERTEQN